ncbi:hypothetical protein [Embleya sp. MST-111070]|uniref:hypothetical protein n=1 Tax=Embleya sp. MST-111070 TaxID=3398231 RepID=UPI003F73D09A
MTYVDLFESAVRLVEVGGRIEVGERRMTGDAAGRQVAVFRVETDADLHADLRGRWHRLEADGPAEVMSIGVRAGTCLEPRADGVGVRG